MAKKKTEEKGPQSADELLALIRKIHGSSIIQKASETAAIQRVKTGIFTLDLALGGGIPLGRVSIFYGPQSSGKTTLLCRTIGQLQKTCVMCAKSELSCECDEYIPHKVAFIDAEGTLDLMWAQLHGVDLEAMTVISPEFGEQAVDIGEALLRSGYIHVLAVDSLAYVVPAAEIERTTGESGMADHARLMNKAFRKWTMAQTHTMHASGFKPTILCTNQVRSKVGLVFGNPEITPGGSAPKFAATIEIRVAAGPKPETEGQADVPVNIPINFKVEKNKTFGPKMAGEYTVWTQSTNERLKGEITTEKDLISWGERSGTIVREGNKWIALNKTYPTRGAFEEILVKDREYRSELEALTLEKSLERGLALFQA